MALPVAISTINVPCKWQGRLQNMDWPVLKLSSWMRMIINETDGGMLLNNNSFQEVQKWESEVMRFWSRYEKVCPQHPVSRLHVCLEQQRRISSKKLCTAQVFVEHRDRLQHCLPFVWHGDEGRGKIKRAVMIESFAAALAWKGHSFRSRLLFTLVPGECYAGDNTLSTLHAELARDLQDLFTEGIEAQTSCYCFCYSSFCGSVQLVNQWAIVMPCVRCPWGRTPSACIVSLLVAEVTGHTNVPRLKMCHL